MSVKSRLTPTKALRLLKELAAERPTHVDPNASSPTKLGQGCKYVENGAPSCIVGNALARHGFALDTIATLDESEFGPIGAGEIPDRLKLVSKGAAAIFDTAQSYQDRGATWGEAVEAVEQNHGITA